MSPDRAIAFLGYRLDGTSTSPLLESTRHARRRRLWPVLRPLPAPSRTGVTRRRVSGDQPIWFFQDEGHRSAGPRFPIVRVVAQLAAQPAHDGARGPHVVAALPAPDPPPQMLVGQDPPGVCRKLGQQWHPASPQRRPTPGEGNGQVAVHVRFQRLGHFTPAQGRPNPRRKLSWREGLDHVVRGPMIEGPSDELLPFRKRRRVGPARPPLQGCPPSVSRRRRGAASGPRARRTASRRTPTQHSQSVGMWTAFGDE